MRSILFRERFHRVPPLVNCQCHCTLRRCTGPSLKKGSYQDLTTDSSRSKFVEGRSRDIVTLTVDCCSRLHNCWRTNILPLHASQQPCLHSGSAALYHFCQLGRPEIWDQVECEAILRVLAVASCLHGGRWLGVRLTTAWIGMVGGSTSSQLGFRRF